MDCSPPGSSVHGVPQARVLEWVAFPSPGDLPDPGIEARSAALQADSLPNESPEQPFSDWYPYKVEKAMAPTPVLLPGKSHGRRSLVGCGPWGREESDTTERLHFHALEKEIATHSSVPAWRLPGTGEPGGLPSMGSHQRRKAEKRRDLEEKAMRRCRQRLTDSAPSQATPGAPRCWKT